MILLCTCINLVFLLLLKSSVNFIILLLGQPIKLKMSRGGGILPLPITNMMLVHSIHFKNVGGRDGRNEQGKEGVRKIGREGGERKDHKFLLLINGRFRNSLHFF